jgi:AraC-like DNA-binding protein
VVGRVGEFLERNLARRVGIEDIAGDLGLSPSQLRLLFKRATSVSLGRYIELTRLTHAFFLLKNSDQNVSQVAYACGYKSIHSFSRMFKRHNGISPRAFRKRERAREE